MSNEMTFNSYINNPGGKGSSVVPNKELIKETFTKQWDDLRLKENGLIMYHMYTDAKDFYIHFKIPSGLIDKFYYDVVIRFYPREANQAMNRSLSEYGVQFYSNDPSFVFTYCYAFKSNGLFIRDLEGRMSRLALKQPAKIKNPKNEVGYVKTIYYAYLEMKRNDLFNKGKWEGRASKYSKTIWNNTITHADDKIKDAQELQSAKRKEDKKLKAKEKNSNEAFERNATNKKPFESPNPKNFGHYNRPSPNTLGVHTRSIQKGFGIFKKSN